MTRKQSNGRGHLYQASGKWYVRYREEIIQPDGSIRSQQVSSPQLATTSEVRSKTEARALADEYLGNLRESAPTALGTMEIVPFVNDVYLPWVKEQREPSTHNGYRKIWNGYFAERLKGIRLRDFHAADGEKLMQRIADEEKTRDKSVLSHTTLTRIKSFLSGIFTHAIRQGYLRGTNPISPVSIPKGGESRDTFAYSVEDELKMISVLPGKLQLAVAIASFTGLSISELRGLEWADYNGETIKVRRKMWKDIVGAPKTKKRRGSVPVVPRLKHYLEIWRQESGWILADELGKPLNLEWLTRTTIAPAVKAAGVTWHGWHAFRRGLATNLDRLGVPDTVIQAVLRHSSVNVTRQSYIKEVRTDVLAAMAQLESAVERQKAGGGKLGYAQSAAVPLQLPKERMN